ncbi:6-O-methylguanine DNA methyltransferase [Streptomyces shenzhenensis]|uniref:6-O-methylguanine DNA methyltransferase n=2 Tax=Streptomyces shenzhenensis TaxID=943815 RepID=A0A3M0IFJ4_9ACTN|nr:6-O-methylguanine DNA methyltransferase [Streptomyces shenzhenensis]
MVAWPSDTQGHQGANAGPHSVPETPPEGEGGHRTARAALSVGWGRMGRMSEESLSEEARAEGRADTLPEYAERVLDVAERIPPGRVMTYGDVAEWLEEGGPRQVGRVMALYGGAVPWWRVVRADGVLLPGHELSALGHYRAEGTPLKEAGRATEGHLPRLDMRRARWDGGESGQGHT